MNIRRKGAGIAFTATLLATLVATVAAPFASASVSVTSAGSVQRGGTSSGTVTFTFTENSAAAFAAGGDSNGLRVTIRDNAGGNTLHFVGTPVVTAPGSLGATAALSNNGTSNNRLDISYAASDTLNVEQITISGLQIAADTGAATGAAQATLAGSSRFDVLPGTTTATGQLLNPQNIGDTALILTNVTGCAFQPTGGLNGQLVFGAGGTAESKNLTATGAVAANQQPVTSAPLTASHPSGQAVSQTVDQVSCGATNIPIGSPVTVTNALTASSAGATQVLPGENNQPAAPVTVAESPASPAGSLNGESLTFVISNPASGVVFSVAPTVYYTGGASGPGTCALSVNRTTCTVSGIASPTGPATVTIAGSGGPASPLLVDVDASVALGTPVKVTVSASPAIAINSATVTIAFVGRVIVGTAAQPTIYIGFNDQPTGTISFTESGPGFFVAGLGGNNTFGICPETGETFTRAPWAVVTVGNLKLLSGVVGVSQVKGTLAVDIDGETCAYWTVYSASTTASTIEIRGSADDTTPLPAGANNGPRMNVPKTGFGATPGSTQTELLIGTQAQVLGDAGFSQIVSNAIRAFKNNVTVTASSQPFCAKGSTDCLGGNIVVTETQNGQFKAGDLISVRILPRATTQRQDVILKTNNTNDLPIVTANTASTGFAVTPVGVNCPPSAILGVVVCQFTFSVTQQAFGPGLGSFTISNIHYVVAADAVEGPVLVEIMNTPGGGQPVDVVVSNANVGTQPVAGTTKTSASSAVGKTTAPTAFSVGTKVIPVVSSSNNIATIRIKVDPALVGKTVVIQMATKNSAGVWSAFVNVTSRVIGSDGFAYYYASQHSPLWASYRGMWAGNSSWAPSTSQTVQIRWT